MELSGALLRGLRGEADDERDTTLVAAVDGDLDAVVAGLFQL